MLLGLFPKKFLRRVKGRSFLEGQLRSGSPVAMRSCAWSPVVFGGKNDPRFPSSTLHDNKMIHCLAAKRSWV